MYNITADYHTHTLYSHGKGTISDNVEIAREKGLEKIAITDHGFGHMFLGVSKSDIQRMRVEIDEINAKYDDIEVLLGIEANLVGIDGAVDIPGDYREFFDIVLMGFHHGAMPHSARDLWKLFGRNIIGGVVPWSRKYTIHDNTMAFVKAMERYPIDIITHPGAKIDIDSQVLARHAAEHGVALEINAGHGYMTVDQVKIAIEAGASFVINSDAHTPGRVGDFKSAIDIAREAGVDPAHIINARKNLL